MKTKTQILGLWSAWMPIRATVGSSRSMKILKCFSLFWVKGVSLFTEMLLGLSSAKPSQPLWKKESRNRNKLLLRAQSSRSPAMMIPQKSYSLRRQNNYPKGLSWQEKYFQEAWRSWELSFRRKLSQYRQLMFPRNQKRWSIILSVLLEKFSSLPLSNSQHCSEWPKKKQ